MSINEYSLKPTLEIDKSKDFENINSIIIDTVKTGRNSVVNIVNNNGISKDDKIYLLQQENLKLLDSLNDVNFKVRNIKENFLYNEYHESWTMNINFEIELSKTSIDFLRKHRAGYQFPIFLVNKKDYSQFILIAEK